MVLAIRGTYFQYDHKTDPSPAPIGIVTGLEIHTVDVEATSRTRFCGSDFMFTGGVRYAHFQQDYSVANVGSLALDTEGTGLTIGTRISRGLGSTAWDLVISGRASILLTDNDIALTGLATATSEESTTKVLEARIGMQRVRELASGAQLVTQFAVETQNWEAPVIAGLLSNDISLFGPTFRVGTKLLGFQGSNLKVVLRVPSGLFHRRMEEAVFC